MRIIAGGTVVDGENPPYPADVIVEGDRVADVVKGGLGCIPEDADLLTAEGLWVTPGFVDMHSHDDVAACCPSVYEGKIRQGITTAAITMDGFGYAALSAEDRDRLVRYWRPVDGDPGDVWGPSIADYVERLKGSLGLNVAIGVPHANLRVAQAGFALRELTPGELEAAAREAEELAGEGAFGLTTGLSYVPAVASSLLELTRLGRAVGAGGGSLYVSHLRDYGTRIFEAVEEALAVGRATGLGVHLSHLHLSHPEVFGRAEELLGLLGRVRREGLQVTWDTYPYTAGSSILYSYLPAWVQDGGPDLLFERLGQESDLKRLDQDPKANAFLWHHVVIASTPTGRWVGESVAQVASRLGMSPARAVAHVLREADLDVSCIVHQTQEADDLLIAEGDGCVVGTDGLPFGTRRHPRYSGAMAAYYRRHVRERSAMTGQEAVRRMSTEAARLLCLGRRGPARGAVADLAVWDPERYTDRSTYEHPDALAEGVRHVLVHGEPVLRDGKFDPTLRPGRWVKSQVR